MKTPSEMMWYRNKLVPVRQVEEMARRAMEPVDTIYEARMARGDRAGALTALVEAFGGRRSQPETAEAEDELESEAALQP